MQPDDSGHGVETAAFLNFFIGRKKQMPSTKIQNKIHRRAFSHYNLQKLVHLLGVPPNLHYLWHHFPYYCYHQ